jgi:hypothetical protein
MFRAFFGKEPAENLVKQYDKGMHGQRRTSHDADAQR